jgi:hypothetical protein
MNEFHAFARYNTLYDLADARIEFQFPISNAKRRRDKNDKKGGRKAHLQRKPDNSRKD